MIPNKRHEITISEQDSGLRLDKWLAQLEFVPSRSRAAELIDLGLVTSNGKILKASTRIKAHETIVVEIPAERTSSDHLQPLDRPIDIIYEDNDLIVVNKPSGLVVHPAAGHAQDTLVNILLHHVDQLSVGFHEKRPGIVHRLDRDTSGILVVAKNDRAHHGLAAQFKNKTAHRIYWAIIHGVPKQKSGTQTSHLARHPTDRKRFASSNKGHGKLAITHYRVIQSLHGQISWVACQLETGRTHQIRVHLSELGHPIVGDPIYGYKSRRPADVRVGRLALHACELGFTHPISGRSMSFKVDWPNDLHGFIREAGF